MANGEFESGNHSRCDTDDVPYCPTEVLPPMTTAVWPLYLTSQEKEGLRPTPIGASAKSPVAAAMKVTGIVAASSVLMFSGIYVHR